MIKLSVQASVLLVLVYSVFGEEPETKIDLDGIYTIPRTSIDKICLLYTSPSPRDATLSRMPSSA